MITPSSKALRPSALNQVAESEGSLGEFLSRMVSLSDSGIYYESDCPICASDHRDKSEKMWLDTRNADAIRQFFVDKGKSYTIPVIKNHMEGHLDQSQDEIRRKEYINKITLLFNSGKVSTIDRIDMALTALQERLVAVNAISDQVKPLSEIEKMKADTTCKITSSMDKLLKLRADMLGEMKKDGEAFAINKQEFVDLFKRLLDAPTDEERYVVNMVFAELHKICREE